MRRGDRGTLALLDGDRFKQVNDRLGHGEGDRLLKTIANKIRDGIRETDIAARWGGDEFVIFFDGLDREAAEAVVTRVHAAVLRRPAALLDGEPVAFSAGFAELSGPGRAALDKAMAHADRALYENKGRRVSV